LARVFRMMCLFALSLVANFHSASAADSTLVSMQTPRGAKQAFILIKPANPVAAVILFAGGHGALGLRSASTMRWGAMNFLVRSRDIFVSHDLMVAVVDAPSDRQGGMNAVFRMGSAHASDITAVAAYLKKQADIPVWLVGTSSGTFSAAGGAIAAKGIDGLVLTSTVTRAKRGDKIAQSHPDGVASMALQRVGVPTLVLSHRKDGCVSSPAADGPKLTKRLSKAAKVDLVLVDGGDLPQSDPCQARSPHGFLGIESEVVGKITAFVKGK
jgi:pimeloyl-ACP methyl ester carboxylesterase